MLDSALGCDSLCPRRDGLCPWSCSPRSQGPLCNTHETHNISVSTMTSMQCSKHLASMDDYFIRKFAQLPKIQPEAAAVPTRPEGEMALFKARQTADPQQQTPSNAQFCTMQSSAVSCAGERLPSPRTQLAPEAPIHPPPCARNCRKLHYAELCAARGLLLGINGLPKGFKSKGHQRPHPVQGWSGTSRGRRPWTWGAPTFPCS